VYFNRISEEVCYCGADGDKGRAMTAGFINGLSFTQNNAKAIRFGSIASSLSQGGARSTRSF
jgi:hypothetical protein